MTNLELPRDLSKGDTTLTATTPAEYWNLTYRGFTPVDGPATAGLSYDELTPAQKRARTLAEKKAAERREQTEGDGDGESTADPANASGTNNVVE